MATGDRARRAAAHATAVAASAVRRPHRLDAGPASDLDSVPGRAGVLLRHLCRAWPPDRVDPRGGFLVQPVARDAEPPPPWRTIAQARVTWFHAALAGARAGAGHADAAAHGARLLRERLWDPEHGGFVFQLDPDGPGSDDSKQLYTNAFGLFAIAQWAKGPGGASALAFADEIFDVIDERWRPSDLTGRPEVLDRRWAAPGEPTGQSLDAYLHLLEACTALAEVTRRPAVHAAVADLTELVGRRLAPHPCGTGPDVFGPGWQPLRPSRRTVSYGHECERISLVLHAAGVLGGDPTPWVERSTHLVDHLAAVAHDRRRGGLWHSGPPCRPAWLRQKTWWVQAEALYAFHSLHALRPGVLTGNLLDRTLEWVERHQLDPVTGDWHAELRGTAVVPGPIAGPWKDPYHAGRALLALTGERC